MVVSILLQREINPIETPKKCSQLWPASRLTFLLHYGGKGSRLVNFCFSFNKKKVLKKLSYKLSLVNSHQLSWNSCSRLTRTSELRKLSYKLSLVNSHQLSSLFTFDQDMKIEKTLIQTIVCHKLMQLLLTTFLGIFTSFDEMAKYDLPATVDYIQTITGQDQLVYIGHSQGTLIAFAAFSNNPELARKISLFIALAPIVTIGNIKDPYLKALAEITTAICVSMMMKMMMMIKMLMMILQPNFTYSGCCTTHRCALPPW